MTQVTQWPLYRRTQCFSLLQNRYLYLSGRNWFPRCCWSGRTSGSQCEFGTTPLNPFTPPRRDPAACFSHVAWKVALMGFAFTAKWRRADAALFLKSLPTLCQACFFFSFFFNLLLQRPHSFHTHARSECVWHPASAGVGVECILAVKHGTLWQTILHFSYEMCCFEKQRGKKSAFTSFKLRRPKSPPCGIHSNELSHHVFRVTLELLVLPALLVKTDPRAWGETVDRRADRVTLASVVPPDLRERRETLERTVPL